MDELDGSEYCKQCGLKNVAQNGSMGALETQARSGPIKAAGASRHGLIVGGWLVYRIDLILLLVPTFANQFGNEFAFV
jgi:hypothetical protein